MFVQCVCLSEKIVTQCFTEEDVTGSTWSAINCVQIVMLKTLPSTCFIVFFE